MCFPDSLRTTRLIRVFNGHTGHFVGFVVLRGSIMIPKMVVRQAAIFGQYCIHIYEPRLDKMCLWEFPTRQETNRPAQPQKLARVLKFRLWNLEILYYLSGEQQRR